MKHVGFGVYLKEVSQSALWLLYSSTDCLLGRVVRTPASESMYRVVSADGLRTLGHVAHVNDAGPYVLGEPHMNCKKPCPWSWLVRLRIPVGPPKLQPSQVEVLSLKGEVLHTEELEPGHALAVGVVRALRWASLNGFDTSLIQGSVPEPQFIGRSS